MLVGPTQRSVVTLTTQASLRGSLTLRAAALPARGRSLHASSKSLAQPPPPSSPPPPPSPTPSSEPRNEAREYLEAKRLRKEARAGQPPSRHALFYSDIVPPLLRILAYGSTAYFALHLLWNVLDRDEQRALADAKTDGYANTIRNLDEQIEQAKQSVTDKAAAAGKEVEIKAEQIKAKASSGWGSWLWPFGTSSGGSDDNGGSGDGSDQGRSAGAATAAA
ncbi:uncharacterized protein PFL1_02616 [Pseudozyma flocculosa PF-1]|uniref:Uncharacterized protein n=2 Tax=Pseudozyma flocculosa TaxID=84751 RepID=A0A5C3F045_9BASI|nr:uncharacterized protein PFL1_02616 [Pseudozyma flocculosa PF-1]EPQ29944.1 hypothetical protein PFL1_02616 [Pseudozyma flocculosa PF-1]SPO37256.1 uncharacterized protein PSFLO_02728 [Pseudozyma flocculosa]